jgi:hypothetical protein
VLYAYVEQRIVGSTRKLKIHSNPFLRSPPVQGVPKLVFPPEVNDPFRRIAIQAVTAVVRTMPFPQRLRNFFVYAGVSSVIARLGGLPQ